MSASQSYNFQQNKLCSVQKIVPKDFMYMEVVKMDAVVHIKSKQI